jgi:soluble lytic murein transglycosylase-like protein
MEPRSAEEIKQLVVNKANQYGINPGIALAQIGRESSFNPHAVGALGERGLGQFTQATWADYGSGSFDNAFDPVANLDAWGNYMVALMGMFGGDYIKALQGYNGGPGNVQRGKVSAKARAYAQAIYSQAGFTESSVVNLDQIGVSPSGLPIWLLIGGLGLLRWVALSD